MNAKERKFGLKTLMYAAGEGHTDIVKALIAKGADVNAKANNDVTAQKGSM